MCPLGRGKLYTDSWVVKGTDGDRDGKLVPNIHSSLLPQT